MTLPSSSAQSARSLSQHPQTLSPAHSISDLSSLSSSSSSVAADATNHSPSKMPGYSSSPDHDEHALDFATHSWDLATGGLKTLTAKREFPVRAERQTNGMMPDILATYRSYMFALVILVCIVLMLIGGGIVLLVMLQP